MNYSQQYFAAIGKDAAFAQLCRLFGLDPGTAPEPFSLDEVKRRAILDGLDRGEDVARIAGRVFYAEADANRWGLREGEEGGGP